ncbi:MAG: guanylate cyclase [Deltaproteobacteria bacterium HGW-Deltaproteobacteria-15]|jgi:class 3 adenylate cyclase|nr:MAG: guanylate cyclase [Deltaproteobacteria bacterium HGW-Deltaproteobacteria-15]
MKPDKGAYYRERFEAQRRILKRLASTMEVNEILEKLREETRTLVPSAMEACILLLDPDAQKYTRPLQCALYGRPVNCLSCKRNRGAVRKAMDRRKGVVVSGSEPITRHDGSKVETGPEAAIPVIVNGDILAVVNVVARPGIRFTNRDFHFIKDISEIVGNALLNAKRHWETTQEKIKISQMLAHLSPFVPQSVRRIVEDYPDQLMQDKEKKEVSVLFLDLENYTRLTANRPEAEVNDIVEKVFSSFVDPIHRSGGDINETAGDGLMIIFKNDDARTNAVNAVRSALDIDQRSRELILGSAPGQHPIHVNMGINSGMALVGLTRFKGQLSTRMTYTATGQVTNIAARLADLATGGDILIGEETGKLIQGLWPVYDRGLIALKGIDEPRRVFSLKPHSAKSIAHSELKTA